ncbi:hypothetical protein DSCO28_07650 [Desulfosarcina ovata subsp. sediminis]|uniref:Uncharacterized protein n=1 Tax=Desulfosarcina ovata subsp. sediminis TaxID=885957 RepID=A0A5K7ZKM6_9BACT|nr:hypothetical protein [Desulfosarcina ovata]BBO80199.1 hypothetical protein DSCO28_07650 [Desulfosarcina ovata subsp. sediminis]
MEKLTLSKHFCQRWQERVGNWPTIDAVRHYLTQSIVVQGGKSLMTFNGSPHRVLALYWCPEIETIMAVDTVQNMAVTVYSRDMADRPHGRKIRKKPARKTDRRQPVNRYKDNVAGTQRTSLPLALRAAAVARNFGARR